MKRKLLAVILCVVFIMGTIVPSVPARADSEPVPHTHGEGDDRITFTAWDDADSLPTEEGNYYLTTDVALSAAWEVSSGEIGLCLNGHVITNASEGGLPYSINLIRISNGATLNLYDCVNTKSYYFEFFDGRLQRMTSSPTDEKYTVIKTGYISGATYTAVCNEGTFNMYGGAIVGNRNIKSQDPENGGGVCNSGTFNLYGGMIAGNQSRRNDKACGGGVYNSENGIFNMYGGKIENNTIRQNTAPERQSYGGGVYNAGKFNFYDGEISNNGADVTGYNFAYFGGGVYSNGVFNMFNGKITRNGVQYLGAAVYSEGEFSFYDGEISNNSAPSDRGAGAVYIASGTFTMNGGKINNNNSPYCVYVSAGDVAILGGTIENNSETGLMIQNNKSVVFGGTAKCINNTNSSGNASNVYLNNGAKIEFSTVTPPAVEMKLGVSVRIAPTLTTPTAISTNGTEAYASSLSLDDTSDYLLNFNSTGSYYEVKLKPGVHIHSIGNSSVKFTAVNHLVSAVR